MVETTINHDMFLMVHTTHKDTDLGDGLLLFGHIWRSGFKFPSIQVHELEMYIFISVYDSKIF